MERRFAGKRILVASLLRPVGSLQRVTLHPSVTPAVLRSDHPGSGRLLQHLLLPEAALPPGRQPGGPAGRAAGGRGPHGGGCLNAAGHGHQDAL